MVDEDSHATDLSVSGEKGHSTTSLAHYIFSFWLRTKLFSNAGYQNCSKMVRDLTFVVQFAYFSIRPKKGFRILEQLLSKFHPKKQLLIVFWVTFRQLFEKFRETFWKISSNLWKAPLIPSVHVLSGYSYVSLKFGCCSHGLNFGIVIRFWETAHLPLPSANIITYFSLSAKCWLKGRWTVSQKRVLIFEFC